MEITLKPVAIVHNKRETPTDDFWGDTISEITLLPHIPTEAFDGVENFSHVEVVYFFDKADEKEIIFSGRPRGNPDYPVTGIFAQRKKDRPNHLGICTAELVKHDGRTITVKFLDAINNTPVLDIKPVFKEFQLKGEIRQSDWVSEMLKDYWR
ncbi:MAG: tRNA (N6-threonylcarbamoyladenosine(37)-N6)-methyltransferase TrmO [Bacteroidia bacterium]